MFVSVADRPRYAAVPGLWIIGDVCTLPGARYGSAAGAAGFAAADRNAPPWGDEGEPGRRQRDRGGGGWRAMRGAGSVLPRAGRFAAVGAPVHPGGARA